MSGHPIKSLLVPQGMRKRLDLITPLIWVLALGLLLPLPNAAAEDAADATSAQIAETVDEPSTATPGDPLEPMNRAIFSFNEDLDDWVLKPVAQTWDFVAPTAVERAIDNFYRNLLFPVRFVNLLLQGELDPAALSLSRFCVNTTLGIGGIFDAASFLDLEPQSADFGQTLGKWGVPPGPYLILPLWGPSNPRDSVGLLVDGYLGVTTFFIDWPILLGSVVAETINRRALLLGQVEDIKEASFDLYVSARDAYEQQRNERILGSEEAARQRDEDLYFIDDFDDFEEEEW
jgi:phospholipid-binding lipoprotein MlaA